MVCDGDCVIGGSLWVSGCLVSLWRPAADLFGGWLAHLRLAFGDFYTAGETPALVRPRWRVVSTVEVRAGVLP